MIGRSLGGRGRVPPTCRQARLRRVQRPRTGRRGWLVLVLAWLALQASAALAWGVLGHRVVAERAWEQMTPSARAAAHRLLALEPGATLASVANWADENRDDTTRPWHFVNLPIGDCSYDAPRDCPQGQCLVVALERQLALLASDAPDVQRLLALKYVVHLVGDLHQPLHAGHLEDRGGNRYQVQAFGNGTNLHALWDSALLQQRNQGVQALVGVLRAQPLPAQARVLDPAHAAQESCRIVDAPGFYPPHTLPDDYADRFGALLQRQLALAAARLAGWLNRVLAQ